MKRQTLVAVLLCAVGSTGQGQVAGRVELMTKVPHAATDADLARMSNRPQLELQQLQREQAAACQSKANAAECERKTKQLNAARPALEKKKAWIAKHESDARRGVLVLRERGPTPVPAGNNCKACHAGASATPAQDPINRVVVSPPGPPVVVSPPGPQKSLPSTRPAATPAEDPIGPGLASPGPQPGSNMGDRKSGSATGCFIATAAFGSADAEAVVALRRFRDQRLEGTWAGDWLIRTYYRVSPPIADAIAERPALRTGVRVFLHGVVLATRSPASLVVLGASLAMLIGIRNWRRRAVS